MTLGGETVESANIKALGILSIQRESAFLSSSPFLHRWVIPFLLLLSLSGCLFFRLSRVLVQMKEPFRFLEVDLESDTFHGKLVEPIVYLKDLEAIVGLKPIAKKGHWVFKFEKMGPSDREPWSFLVWTDKRDRLTAFELPPRVTSILGNRWVMSGIRAIGKSEVSIRQRRVFLEVEERLTKSQIKDLLGEPTLKKLENWVYHFGSESQPLILDLDMTSKGVRSMLMSSGKLSASFMFLEEEEDSP
jgi:hypothetical protein